MPNGYSIWSPVFKNIDGSKVDLTQIKPCLTNNTPVTFNGTVMINKLSVGNVYESTYLWHGSVQKWSKDNGATFAEPGDVTFSTGEGFAMNNGVKVNAKCEEGSTRAYSSAPARFFVSGEVDLICKNLCPSGYSISGNATPVVLDLTDITPCLTNNTPVTFNGTVMINKLAADNHYEATYGWYGSVQKWSKDNGSTYAKKGDVIFQPGEGFAMNNGVKVNAKCEEGSTRAYSSSPCIMSLKSPLSDEM